MATSKAEAARRVQAKRAVRRLEAAAPEMLKELENIRHPGGQGARRGAPRARARGGLMEARLAYLLAGVGAFVVFNLIVFVLDWQDTADRKLIAAEKRKQVARRAGRQPLGPGEWRCRCKPDPEFDTSVNERGVRACTKCGAVRPPGLERRAR